MSKLAELKRELEIAEKAVGSKLITKNPMMKKVAEKKVAALKDKIKEEESKESKSKTKSVKKVVAPKKVEKVVSKKAKEAKPKKEVKVSAATKKEMKRHKQGRSKSDLARDAKRSALKGGKRISAEGNVYYENRPNRSDVNPRTRFEKGGSVEGDKYIVVNEKILAVTMPNRFNNTKGTDEAEVLAVKPSEIGFTKIGDVFFLKGKKSRPATSEDFDAYKVVEPKGSKSDYKIVTGFDHKNNHELYHVVGIDNDYVGEWHKDKKDAENELKDLNGSKFEEGGNIEEEDLFENYDELPVEVQDVLSSYQDEEGDYSDLEEMQEELKPLGYTFDYGLDAVPMNLRKIEKMVKGGSIATCPVGTKIQTIIFSKEFYNKVRAVKWLNRNNFKGTIADDKSTTVRFRQASPDKFKEDTFRTIELTKGVKAVIGCPKK